MVNASSSSLAVQVRTSPPDIKPLKVKTIRGFFISNNINNSWFTALDLDPSPLTGPPQSQA
jgi:hypothetical protein